MPTVNIEILPKQRLFLQATTRGKIFLSGIGGGKSRVLCYDAIIKALRGRKVLIASFSYRMLYDVILDTLKKTLPLFGLANMQDGTLLHLGNMSLTLGEGSIMLRSGDEPDRLRGINISDFYLDECRQFKTREIFDILLGRLRDREDSSWALCTTTRGRDWVYKMIQEAKLESVWDTGYARNDDLTVITQKTEENIFLPESYIRDLRKQYTGLFARQELDAAIVDFSAGIFYKHWFDNRDMPWKPTNGVRYWDLASSTDPSADFSVGVLMARNGAVTNVVDVKRVQMSYPELRELIIATAERDGTGITIAIEKIGMQTAIADDIISDQRLSRFKVKAHNIYRTGKLERAMPLTSRFENGSLRLCNAPWNDDYVEEMCGFSGNDKGHDDQCDATSGAWAVLNISPLFRSLKDKYEAPPKDKTIEIYVAMEIHNFQATIVRAAWHPTKEILWVIDELESSSMDEIVAFMKPAKHRHGPVELESDSLKAVASQFVRKGVPVMTGKLDLNGAVYSANQLLDKGNLNISLDTSVYSEAIAADQDADPTSHVRCLLRVIQEVMGRKPAVEKEYAPFERQREEYRRKVKMSQSANKEWVG
jgi:predicted phage terminase large subunit-like protein